MAPVGPGSRAFASSASDCPAAPTFDDEATVGPMPLGEEVLVGPMPLRILHPETTVAASQQAANLVTRLREYNKIKTPTTRHREKILRKYLVNHHG
jgi:hypothetical protein